ncbi:MAG: ABC transporter substrate-binding protein [Lachnospiraceae bacterium]|nr:ABC transporter substrate-binding protein [Lachnospiraceae bacterium]
MKKMTSFVFAMLMVAGLSVSAGNVLAVSAEEAAQTVTVTGLDASGEAVEVEVPYDPQRVAVVDMAALDILDNLGLGDRVVGSSSTALEYLQDYMNNDNVANLGTVKEADFEAVMASEPDIIFMGGRMSESYEELSEIAPVVRLTTDTELGLVESVRKNATTVASIFGLEDEVEEKLAGYDSRIAALAAFAEGKNALIGMCTSGSFNILDNAGRCSLIGREVGFENLGDSSEDSGEEAQSEGSTEGRGEGERSGEGGRSGGRGQGGGGTATHGNEASFELVVSMNPDYIFVMDRDAAIGTDGAQLAQEIMENELVMGTDAYKNGNIVYLEHPAVWYTAEGGITALDYMLADLEGALLQ